MMKLVSIQDLYRGVTVSLLDKISCRTAGELLCTWFHISVRVYYFWSAYELT